MYSDLGPQTDPSKKDYKNTENGPLTTVNINAFTEYPSCQLKKRQFSDLLKSIFQFFIDSVESTSSLKKLAHFRFPNGQT
jgi:hypothetical protein